MSEPPNQSPPVQNTQPDGSPEKEKGNNNPHISQSNREVQNNAKPMELEEREQKDVEIGVFKKFFLKIGEKVGTVKTTEYGEDYLAAVTEIDNYKTNLNFLLNALTKVIQPNGDFIPKSELRNAIDAPMGEDPYEHLSKALDTYAHLSANKKLIQSLAESSKKLASSHRDYQGKARKCFHNIRTFLKIDLENIRIEREKVIKCRQEMDFAKHECEGSESKSKLRALEKKKKVYDIQCKKVIAIVHDMADKRIQHQVEVLRFMQDLRNFNEYAAKECEKVRPILAKLIASMPPPPPPVAKSPLDDSQR